MSQRLTFNNPRALPAFQDNYIWMLGTDQHSLVVDPGDAAPVIAALEPLPCERLSILLTHHHGDHQGGVAALLAYAETRAITVEVYGPGDGRCRGVTVPVHEGDRLSWTDLPGFALTVYEVPGHTSDHVAYFGGLKADEAPGANQAAPWLFCGDTLFAGGCGRLFEGSAAQMQNSLQRLAALPTQTLVYCAHEYTLGNLRFALAAEPDNTALQARWQTDSARREAGLSTVPSTLADELATNPYLRAHLPALAQHLPAIHLEQAQHSAADDSALTTWTALRLWKNSF